nr:11066_t:CDS:2 [Entrophospora candida]
MDPVTLPCGNTFCRSCLMQYTSLPNGRFNCPIVGCSRIHCKDARTDVTIQKLSDRCPNQAIRDILVQDVECTVCFHLFLDPITTSCGHTFCKSCLTRSLDHSGSCPLCRHPFHNYASILNHPVNKSITTFIKSMYPSLFFDRIRLAESELSDTMRETPLFISTLIFPSMPCFIHISEAHYRLMLRRCLDSRARQFGMVLGRGGNNDYYEYGTMLEIKSAEFLTDGRSLVETIGTYRFRILTRSKKDGYDVGDIERIDDVSPDEEADLERDAIRRAEINNQDPSNPRIYEPTTSELIATAHQFIETLKNGNAPWVLPHLNTTFGDMPDDPSDFSFWVASFIPIDDSEKYKLLEKRSIRERLKMVVSWINQLKEQWWFARDCVIS